MKTTANKRKTTTLSCDKSTREFVATEAARTGLLQREILARMVEVYQLDQKRSATKKKDDLEDLRSAKQIFTAIDKKLDKAIKRDDVVLAFIKTHESELSSPTLDRVKNCEMLLNQLVSILQNLK